MRDGKFVGPKKGRSRDLLTAVEWKPRSFHGLALTLSLEWKDLVESSALGFVICRAYIGSWETEEQIKQNFKFTYIPGSWSDWQEKGLLYKNLRSQSEKFGKAYRIPLDQWHKYSKFSTFQVKHEESSKLTAEGGKYRQTLQERYAQEVFRKLRKYYRNRCEKSMNLDIFNSSSVASHWLVNRLTASKKLNINGSRMFSERSILKKLRDEACRS